jgi:hypothetical protein
MSTVEVVAEHSQISYQECVQCGGVFMVWADPQARPIEDAIAANRDDVEVHAAWFRYRDGATPVTGEIIRCSDCLGFDYRSLMPDQRRWAAALPPSPPPPSPEGVL